MRSLSLPKMNWNHCLRGFKGRWEAWQVPKERLGRGQSRSGLTITQTIPMPVLLKVGSGLLDEGSKALDEMEEEARAAPLQVLRLSNCQSKFSNYFWMNLSTGPKCWVV